MKLKVGDKAPDFKLPSHLDKEVIFNDLRGTTTALAFFPLACRLAPACRRCSRHERWTPV